MTTPPPVRRVQDDELLLDRLGQREPSGADDPVGALLENWVTAIDADAVGVSFHRPAPDGTHSGALEGITSARRPNGSVRLIRLSGSRFIAVVGTAVLVSGAGVAAALTGHEIPGVSGLLRSVREPILVAPVTETPAGAPTLDRARAYAMIGKSRALIAQGDLQQARQLAARVRLEALQAPDVMNELNKLDSELAGTSTASSVWLPDIGVLFTNSGPVPQKVPTGKGDGSSTTGSVSTPSGGDLERTEQPEVIHPAIADSRPSTSSPHGAPSASSNTPATTKDQQDKEPDKKQDTDSERPSSPTSDPRHSPEPSVPVDGNELQRPTQSRSLPPSDPHRETSLPPPREAPHQPGKAPAAPDRTSVVKRHEGGSAEPQHETNESPPSSAQPAADGGHRRAGRRNRAQVTGRDTSRPARPDGDRPAGHGGWSMPAPPVVPSPRPVPKPSDPPTPTRPAQPASSKPEWMHTESSNPPTFDLPDPPEAAVPAEPVPSAPSHVPMTHPSRIPDLADGDHDGDEDQPRPGRHRRPDGDEETDRIDRPDRTSGGRHRRDESEGEDRDSGDSKESDRGSGKPDGDSGDSKESDRGSDGSDKGEGHDGD